MTQSPLLNTLVTLLVGALGAFLGHALHFPIFILTGPAILITLLSLFGLRFEVMPVFRDGAFLLIGINIGAGVTPDTTAAFVKWPAAFAVLALMLLAVMALTPPLLRRFFGYERRSAILAATPGHLSYVLALSAELKANVVEISVAQSVRLFTLTMLVPFVALAFGLDLSGTGAMPPVVMPWAHLAILAPVALLVGLAFKRLHLPAAFLIGAMVSSALAQASEVTQGALSPVLALPGLMVVGTLIGARFNGVTLTMLRGGFLAGVLGTLVGLMLALLAAWPVSVWLGMPIVHVLVAFAPGGLETMVAIGSVVGANTGFVAAAHVARLLILLGLVPLFLHARRRRE